MANNTSSNALNPNTLEFSPARIMSPKADTGEVATSVSHPDSSSNPALPLPPGHTKNNGFSFPYTYHGTTYYTRPPPPLPPPPLPHDGWVPFYTVNHMMENGYSAVQSNGYGHHHSNGYVQSFSTGYTIPHYNNNFHQHFYNYSCSNTFPLHTPYIGGNLNPDLSAPFTNQMSQVHSIRSGLIGQQNIPTRHDSLISDNGQAGNGEWKKKKKNKRNKRKKHNKGKGKKKDGPANSGDEADLSEEILDEANGNHVDQNGKFEVYSDSNQVHNKGDVDGQAISDDEVDGQVNSGVAVHQNGWVATEVKNNGKADLSDLLNSDLFCEYEEVNDDINGMNNANDEQRRRH